MSQDPLNQALPYVTRDMLSFEGNATFGLNCRIQSNDPGNLTIRGATKAGPFTLQVPGSPLGDYAVTTRTFRLPDIPVWLSVNDEIGNFPIGAAFIVVSLTVNGDVVHNLVGGYVHQQHPIAWPTTRADDMTIKGQILSFQGADPAAGVETSITVPTVNAWRLLGWTANLVAGAAAANRIVHLKATNGGRVVFEVISSTTQIINENKVYHANINSPGGAATDDNDIILALPHDIYLPQTTTITTETTALNALDNWGAPQVWVEQFITI